MKSNDTQSLETVQTLLAALFDSAPMAIAIFSVRGVHDMAIASAAAYYGLTIEEMRLVGWGAEACDPAV